MEIRGVQTSVLPNLNFLRDPLIRQTSSKKVKQRLWHVGAADFEGRAILSRF